MNGVEFGAVCLVLALVHAAGYFRGKAAADPGPPARTPSPAPFAWEVESDGQRVRTEAPTLDGLLDLVERTSVLRT